MNYEINIQIPNEDPKITFVATGPAGPAGAAGQDSIVGTVTDGTITAAKLNDASLSGIKTLTLPDNTTITSFTAGLLDDSDAAAARTTLGLSDTSSRANIAANTSGTADTVKVTANTGTGETNKLVFIGGGAGATVAGQSADVSLQNDSDLTYNPGTGEFKAMKIRGLTSLQGDIVGNTDTDLRVESDKNITFVADFDEDNSSALYSFKYRATQIASLDQSGNLQIDGSLSAKSNTDSANQTGGDLIINTGVGTGTGTSGSIIFKGHAAGSSGSTEGTLAEVAKIDHAGNLTISGSATLGTTITLGSTIQHDGDTNNNIAFGTASQTFNTDTASFVSVNPNDPLVIIKNTNTDANSSRLKFLKDKGAAGSDSDSIGVIDFESLNSAQEETDFGKILVQINEATDTDEAGKMFLQVASSDGSTSNLRDSLTLTGHATSDIVDAAIGYGASSTVTTAGNLTVTSNLTLGSSTAVSSILNQNDLSSNSPSALATQQSIKAYVDAQTISDLANTNITSPADGSLLLYDEGTSKWIDNVMSGDATLTDTGAITLATVNSNTGTFGSSTVVPVITVNAKGLITAVSTAGVASGSSLTIGADSGSDDTVTVGTDTLNFSGGDGIATTVSDNDISIAANVDNSSLEINLDQLRVKASGITNNMLNGSIADTKLNSISTANKVAISALDIDSGTDIGAALVDADLFIVDDGAGGTNRKATMSRLKTYMALDAKAPTADPTFTGTSAFVNLDISGNVDVDGTLETDALTINTIDISEVINDRIGSVITAGEGINVANDDSANTVTISGEDATDSNKGIASFSSDNFAVNSGTVTIKTDGIDTNELVNNAVTTDKITNDSVTADKLANTNVTAGSYTAADITVDAQGRITSAASGEIATSEIANGAVTFDKIQNVATDTIVGRTANGDGVTKALSKSEVLDILNVADGAQVNVATNLGTTTAGNEITITSSTGNNASIGEATSIAAGLMSTTHHDKLDGIAASANNYSLNLTKLNAVTSVMTGTDTLTFGDSGDDTSVAIKGTLSLASNLSMGDNNITNVGDIALDTISADDASVGIGVSLTDDLATAFTIKQGSDAYLTVDTTNSSESVSIGTGISGTAITIGHATSQTTIGDNLIVNGDLTVAGDTTTVNTATLTVEDPLIKLASGNTSGDTVDIGLFGVYDTSGSTDLYSGLFRDASDSGKWKLFKDSQTDPGTGTTIDTSATGYAVATLVANIEGNVTGNVNGSSGTVTDLGTAEAGSDVTFSGTNNRTLTIGNGKVTLAKQANLDEDRIVGRANSAGTGAPTALTAAQVRTIIGLDQTLTSGATPTFGTANFTDAADKRLITDAQQTVLSNTSGTNTGDQTNISGNAATATKLAATKTINGTAFDGSSNITLGNDSVTNDMMADDAIDTAQLADGAVDTDRLGADAVTGAKLADNAVDSEHYTDGSIDTAHIADDQVTYAKIQNVSATNRILGRDSLGAGIIEEITPANLRQMINVADGATADQNLFSTIAVSGQNNVVADGTSDTLTLVAGTNITITTDQDADSVTINSINTAAPAIENNSGTPEFASGITKAEVLSLLNIEDGATADQTKTDIDGLAITTVGILDTGSITTGFGNIDNGSSTITTGSLTVDSVAIDGTTIGHTSLTDILTFSSSGSIVTVKDGAYDFDIASHNGTNGLKLEGTLVTATAAELNILDGVTSTTAELNILDGVTSTTAELNILDGVTSTAAELNILDGVTSTASELNILDGVTSTTAELNILDGVTSTSAELNLLDGSSAGSIQNSKAVIYGASGEVNATTLQISGTAITSTAAELNILDGVTSTTAELNVLDGITAVVGELNALDIGTTAIGTAVASKAVILDANKDYTGLRNFTVTGNLTGKVKYQIAGSQQAAGTAAGGDVIFVGTTNLDAGKIYYLNSSSEWTLADAGGTGSSAESTAKGLLGVALGDATGASAGVLLRGIVTLSTHAGSAVGVPIYLSTTEGQATGTPPSGTGDIVRSLGYNVRHDGDRCEVYFNPDNTYIEV